MLFVPCFALELFAGDILEPDQSFSNVHFIKNYDGDSITFDIPGTPSIVGKNIVVRVRGIDSPEMTKHKCQVEMKLAVQARDLVTDLLSNAKNITLHRIGRGKYFRILADVEFDGNDLATILLEKKLAVSYMGGTKEYDWCKDTSTPINPMPHSRSVLPPKISGVYVWPPPPTPKQKNDKQ